MKRAYGSEPILLSASPVKQQVVAPKQKSRRKLFVAAVLTLSICLLSLLAWFAWPSKVNLIPVAINSAVSYPLYQPGWLPSGTHVDKSSFRAASGVVAFAITYGSGKNIVVTEQAKPSQFDFADFYQNEMAQTKNVNVPAGTAVLGTFNGDQLASLTTDQTWILLHAPNNTASAAELEHIVRSLRR